MTTNLNPGTIISLPAGYICKIIRRNRVTYTIEDAYKETWGVSRGQDMQVLKDEPFPQLPFSSSQKLSYFSEEEKVLLSDEESFHIIPEHLRIYRLPESLEGKTGVIERFRSSMVHVTVEGFGKVWVHASMINKL